MIDSSTQEAAATVGHNIQLAVAPVFLIAGVAGLLNVMTSRLARVVDRGRTLEAEIAGDPDGEPRTRHIAELAMLDKRMVRINRAIILSTLAILLVCLVVVAIFTGALIHADLSRLIAGLFIATMLALVSGLLSFLGEIAISAKTLRIALEFRKS